MYKIPADTLFLGKNLVILPECPSTNTLAAEMSEAGQAPEGTTIITHHQTSGRGQRGNTWESGKGLNLTFSIVLTPAALMAVEQFQLNKAVALGISDVVQKYTTEPVRIKWPNDIMIGDKKVCGVLIENQLKTVRVVRSIVGIGLNVKQAEFPTSLGTSMSLHSDKEIDMVLLFDELLRSIEWRYLQVGKELGVRRQEAGGVGTDYLKNLYRMGERHKFIVDEREVEGVIRNVDLTGKLEVVIDNTSRFFDLKEIKYVY